MNDEPKDQRIPIMMSASEVEAIDDWGFKNRVRTRAAAVRILVQQGLIYEDLHNNVTEFMRVLLDYMDATTPRGIFSKVDRSRIDILTEKLESIATKFSDLDESTARRLKDVISSIVKDEKLAREGEPPQS